MVYTKNKILPFKPIRNIEEHIEIHNFKALDLFSESKKENFTRVWELATREIEEFQRKNFTANPDVLIVDIDVKNPFDIRDNTIVDKNPYQVLEGSVLAASIFNIHQICFVIRGDNSKIFEKLNSANKIFLNTLQLSHPEITTKVKIEFIVAPNNTFYNQNLLTSLCTGKIPSPMQFKTFAKFRENGEQENVESIILDLETIVRLPGLMIDSISESLKTFDQNFLVSLTGDANIPGVHEIVSGVEFSDILNKKARGLRENLRLRAIKLAGIFSPVLPAGEAMKLNLDYQAYKTNHSNFSTPTIILLSEETSIKQNLIDTLKIFATTACGFCIYGRESLRIINSELLRVKDYGFSDWENLAEIAQKLKENGYCDFPNPIPKIINSCLKNFPEDFQ